MQKSFLIALALACVFLQVSGAPKNYQIDYCGDCPYSNCCDFSFKCANSYSQCVYYGNYAVSNPSSRCSNSSCPYSCCINGVCGTYAQCNSDYCYNSGCKSGCCATGSICGSKNYCRSGVLAFSIPIYIGLAVACLLVLVGCVVCCKASNLSGKYKQKDAVIGNAANNTVYSGQPNPSQPLMNGQPQQQNFNNYNYQQYPQQQQQPTGFTQMQGYNTNTYAQQ